MMWGVTLTLVCVCWEAQEFAIPVTFFALGMLHVPISRHDVLGAVLVCSAVCVLGSVLVCAAVVCVFGVVAHMGGIE